MLALPLGQEGVEQFARPLDVLRECVCVSRERDGRGSWLTLWRGVAWPIITDTTLGRTPAASSQVAAVWRASCSVIG